MSSMKVTTFKIKSNKPKAARRSRVQKFSDLVPEQEVFKLQDHIGTTYYIVKLEKISSIRYGDGFVVHLKEFPNAKDTLTAGVFGVVPCQQLEGLYQATNSGERISLTSPIMVSTEEVPTANGMSYRFK